jgi:hypothetical protein
VLAFPAQAVMVVEHQTAYLDNFLFVAHLERIKALIEQWKTYCGQELRPNWYKDISTAMVCGVRQNGIGWRAVDNDQIKVTCNL